MRKSVLIGLVLTLVFVALLTNLFLFAGFELSGHVESVCAFLIEPGSEKLEIPQLVVHNTPPTPIPIPPKVPSETLTLNIPTISHTEPPNVAKDNKIESSVSLGILTYCDSKCMTMYGAAISSVQCYAEKHNHKYFLEKNSIPGVHAKWSSIELGKAKLPKAEVDWLLILDADVVVANWDKKLTDFIVDGYDMIFVERVHNGEIMSAGVFIKNSEKGRTFLQDWTAVRETAHLGNDNGSLHRVLLDYLPLEEKETCLEFWPGGRTRNYDAFYACVKDKMGNRRHFPDESIFIYRPFLGFFRCMEERWDYDGEFGIHHNWLGNELFAHTKFPGDYFPVKHVCLGDETGVVRNDLSLTFDQAKDALIRGAARFPFPSEALSSVDCFPECPIDIEWKDHWWNTCQKCCDIDQTCASYRDNDFTKECWDVKGGKEFIGRDTCLF